MPALVNISVGSLRGTSGDDGTISWPFALKKFRNVDLISLTPLMLVQSQNRRALAANRSFLRSHAFRQGGWRCPESVQEIRGLPHRGKARRINPVDNAAAALTVLAQACFLLSTGDSHVGRDRLAPAPKEQPPRKLSGKRTA